MAVCFILIFLTLAIFSGYLSATDQIKATAYPVATTKLFGNSVQFECNVTEPQGSSQTLAWYFEWDEDTEPIRLLPATQSGAISVLNRPEFTGRGDYKTRYEVTESPGGNKDHICTMNIESTTLKDNGYFGCTHQTPGESHRTLLYHKARLTIVPEPTANPECNLNKHFNTFVLTCVSLQGDPQAHLTWFEGTENKSDSIQTFNSIEVQEQYNQQRTFVCNAKQGETDVGTCSVTLTGTTGETDNYYSHSLAPVESSTVRMTTSVESKMTTSGSRGVSRMTTSGSPGESKMTTSGSPVKSKMTTSGSPVESQITTSTDSPVIVVVSGYSTTGAIVNGILGTFILFVLLLLLLFFHRRRRRQRQEANNNAEAMRPSTSTYQDLNGGSYVSPYMEVEPTVTHLYDRTSTKSDDSAEYSSLSNQDVDDGSYVVNITNPDTHLYATTIV